MSPVLQLLTSDMLISAGLASTAYLLSAGLLTLSTYGTPHAPSGRAISLYFVGTFFMAAQLITRIVGSLQQITFHKALETALEVGDYAFYFLGALTAILFPLLLFPFLRIHLAQIPFFSSIRADGELDTTPATVVSVVLLLVVVLWMFSSFGTPRIYTFGLGSATIQCWIAFKLGGRTDEMMRPERYPS